MKPTTTMLIFCVAGLSALGMVMLFSASTGQPEARYLIMQPIWCALGLIVCLSVASLDYRWLRKYPWVPGVILAMAVVVLALTLVPGIGIKTNGARRWLGAGSLRFQPSEFAKIALIIFLAFYGERYQRQMPKFWRGIMVPGLCICVVLGLIFLEPDVGTALLLGAVSAVVLLIAGIRWTYFLPPACLALIAVSIFIWQNPMRSERIYSWLHLEETKQDKGLQAYQAMVALGSGGVTGLGLGDGRQKLGFVPEHHTDFIFSVIGEELGLAATLAVVSAFVVIVFCGVFIAWKARDTFGMLLASGITFLLGFQAVINIGVVTGTFPNKGLSLPFISYGGSNMIMMLSCVGLLISIARQAAGSQRVLTKAFDSGGLTAQHA